MSQKNNRYEYIKAWRKANPDKVLATRKRFNARHRERINAEAREYRVVNPAKVYATNHRPLAEVSRRQQCHKKRAVAAGSNPGGLSAAEWVEILEVFDHRCAYCLRKCDTLEMDHFTTITAGGANDTSNIVPACRQCNCNKSSLNVFGWFGKCVGANQMAKRGRKPNLYYGVTSVTGTEDLINIVVRVPAYSFTDKDEHIRKRDIVKAGAACGALDVFTEYLDIWHNNIPDIGPLPVAHPVEEQG